ncbi:recombinase family protein [Telmatospirillum sp. J64-1]|uniref:recombinase family protein n=1 Tax=Telmatospirillum sp. J64-1 TaxID=2502183 RepID=UPI00115CB052
MPPKRPILPRAKVSNNELYIGRLIWNRLRYIKDPDSGKRVSRLNPKGQWVIQEVPEMQIVEDELWQQVKAQAPPPPKLGGALSAEGGGAAPDA